MTEMHLPGTPSLFFLFYLFVFLPWAAIRSARRLRPAEGVAARPAPSRRSIWTGTLLLQGLLLYLAWQVGRGFGYDVFAVPALHPEDGLAVLVALAVCFLLRAVLRASRSAAERRQLVVYSLAPRTAAEEALRAAAVLLASVAEEAAYRGVAVSILWYALGSFWLAAGLSAVAFALAHWTQGLKSGVTIFAIALILQGLVAATGTLVLAMVVHALYDFVAGYLIAKEARRFDQQAAAAPPAAAPEP